MSLASYANTSVSAGRTKEQIEKLLDKVGATGFRWDSTRPNGDLCGFEQITAGLEWNDKKVAFQLRITYEDERKQRQNLRALYRYLKAKIEAIEFGIVDLEFLPYLLASSGRTMYDELGGPRLRLLTTPEREEED